MNCHNQKNEINENEHNDHSEHNHEHKLKQKHSGHNHGWMMVLCLLPMIAIIIYSMFKGSSAQSTNNSSWWLYLIILLCPLSHIFMMKGMHGHHKGKEDSSIKEE